VQKKLKNTIQNTINKVNKTETKIDEIIPFYLAYYSWKGGDSAKISIEETTKDLNLNKSEIINVTKFLEKNDFIESKDNHFLLTNKGIKSVNIAILSLIFKWASIPSNHKDFGTIQNIFLYSYQKYNNIYIFKNIKEKYILNFSHNLLNLLTTLIDKDEMSEYSSLRKFTIRLSLYPIKEVVSSKLDGTNDILKLLLSKKIIKIIDSYQNKNVILLKRKAFVKGNYGKK
jgi:predicted transcriptional regulator